MIKKSFYKKILKKIKSSKKIRGAGRDIIYGAGGGVGATVLIGGGSLAIDSSKKDRYLPKGYLE